MNVELIEYSDKNHKDLIKCIDGLQKHVIEIDPLHRETASSGYAETYTENLLKAVREKEGKIFFAEVDEKIAGVIAGTIQQEAYGGTMEVIPAKSAWVRELYVDQAYRGNGIGTLLMNKLEEYFINQGCTLVLLNIFAPNVDSHDFYKAKGYVDRGITMLKEISKQAIGIDIGNVIINNRSVDPEIKKVDEATYASFPPTEGVFDAIKTINEYFHGNVFLVSKCTEWAQEQILLWLESHDFYTKTGVKPGNVYFVRQRNEKDGICRKLGITHFVDDRLEVLGHMIESTPNLILFQPDQNEVEEFKRFLPKVKVVNSWQEVIHSCATS